MKILTKTCIIISILLINSKTYSQSELTINKSDNSLLIKVLNNSKIIADTKTDDLSIRIYKIANEPGSAGNESGEATHNLLVAVSEFDEFPKQNLFEIGPFYSPAFEVWENGEFDKIFKIEYGEYSKRNLINLSVNINELKIIQETLEDKILIIRKNFNYINDNILNFKKSDKDVFMSTEGGNIAVYKEGNLIVKIHEQHYGENGKAFIDSYYKNGELSFIFKQTFFYNAPMYRNEEYVEDGIVFPAFDQDKTKVEEDRFYFYNNEMIRWINSEGEYVKSDSEEFKDMEERLITSDKELMEEIK